MNTNQHTPGPWRVDQWSDVIRVSNCKSGFSNVVICEYIDDDATDPEMIANARLIAKSPELMTRLEDLTNAMLSILDGIDSGANSLMTDDGDPQPVNLDHARHALLQAQELLKGI